MIIGIVILAILIIAVSTSGGTQTVEPSIINVASPIVPPVIIQEPPVVKAPEPLVNPVTLFKTQAPVSTSLAAPTRYPLIDPVTKQITWQQF